MTGWAGGLSTCLRQTFKTTMPSPSATIPIFRCNSLRPSSRWANPGLRDGLAHPRTHACVAVSTHRLDLFIRGAVAQIRWEPMLMTLAARMDCWLVVRKAGRCARSTWSSRVTSRGAITSPARRPGCERVVAVYSGHSINCLIAWIALSSRFPQSLGIGKYSTCHCERPKGGSLVNGGAISSSHHEEIASGANAPS